LAAPAIASAASNDAVVGGGGVDRAHAVGLAVGLAGPVPRGPGHIPESRTAVVVHGVDGFHGRCHLGGGERVAWR
jgi:hypothetical protein